MSWQHVWRMVPALLLLTLVLAGCGDPYLSAINPQAPVAQEQYDLLLFVGALMTIIIVVVAVLFIIVLIRFRERPGQTGYPKQVEGSLKLEIIWTAIPLLILAVIAVPTVTMTFSLAEDYSDDPNTINVKVTAYQYWWEFEYTDLGIHTAQELVLPTNQRVFFELTSKDVIHSFWVPALGGKIDTNPGLINTMYLETSDVTGVFKGKCAELCGESHALMDFKVVVVEPEEFEAWVNGMTNAVDEPSTDLAQRGREVYQEQSCFACHAIAGEGGMTAPNLTGFAEREMVGGILELNHENVKRWVTNPEDVKPGSQMPSYAHLSDEDMNALVEYLMDLKLNK